METKSLLKFLHVAAAVAALVVFLAAPFFSYGGKYDVSGADMLDRMDGDSGWLLLFLALPVLAALSNISDNKVLRALASGSLFLPVLIAVGKGGRGSELAEGAIIYCMLAVVMIVLALVAPDEDAAPAAQSAARPAPQPANEPDKAAQEQAVRAYDEAKLHQIVDNAAIYNPQLVEACRQELSIRAAAVTLMPQVREMDDARLREILAAPATYNAEMVYCCGVEMNERRRVAQEQLEKEAEAARIEHEKVLEEQRIAREKAEKEAAERAAAAWKKWRPRVFAAAALIVVLAVIAYLCSDAHHYRRGVSLAEKGRTDRAIECLSRIDNPKSKHYADAKYRLFGQYLKQQDSTSAAGALAAAAVNRNWAEHPAAYELYADYCRNGLFVPYIPFDALRAADYYSLSDDEQLLIKAARIYFDRANYTRTYEVCSAIEHNPTAQGYIGMMYLYGLGGRTRNAETAWDYLKNAPDELPFVVHKGDLTLLLRKGSSRTYSSVEAAEPYYAAAARLAPDNKSYAVRYQVVKNIVAAKAKHDEINYWDRGPVYWHSYTFDGGAYEGEFLGGAFGGGSAHGWGFFTWTASDEIRLGRYSNGLNSGPGMNISESRISVGTLSGNQGTLVEGSYFWSDGDVWTGTWKNGKLVKGRKYNLQGNVLETVK